MVQYFYSQTRGTLLLAILVLVLLPTTLLGEELAVTREPGVRVKMRDGISLVADIYRPQGSGKYPVLLQRTPYNRQGDAQTAQSLASHGYAVILQDTRGRFDSEGIFYPFRYESQDGYDTVEWAARQEFCNGQVGMFGGSYVGATQWLTTLAKPPHLVAILPYVTASEYYDGWTYQSGVLMQWFTSTWSSGLAEDALRREVDKRLRPGEWIQQLPVEQYRIHDLPTMNELTPYFRDWIEHEQSDDYWRPWKISDHYGELGVKALSAGGWHDIFLKGTIENFMGLRQQAGTPALRNGQRLLVGPWGHVSTSPDGQVGDVTFGKQAVLDMTALILAWYDYTLKGIQNEFANQPPVRIFVMGENVWRNEQEFPLARARTTKYYLHAARGAATVAGDGLLSEQEPKQQPPDTFVYDPLQAVPTLGGRLCCNAEVPGGPFDQRANEGRPDVLVFSTTPLEKDTEVTGFIKVELHASTSAVDTDFTALLADVSPDGYARYLADGVVRARYRNSTNKAEALVPGQIYKYNIDLWATSNVFKAGHRIRLYVSSSNFPRFNRNLNTGEPTLKATHLVKANQTIYHDGAHPSALLLPIIPR
jgi:uncharacterized protein